MTEWIKCSDRLPEIFDYVLVCANFQGTGEPKPIRIARRTREWDEVWTEEWEFLSENNNLGAWMDISYNMDTEDITHWMPLPKPPE